ncbi:MAG: hypothetical protein DRI84_04885 [Bacteroidetes bacterium]|nr:MAG: hypothetical protein DRI84_04885 [Bacteroidota bacterium]
MTEIISNSEKIIKKLKKDGKIESLNKTKDLDAIIEMNSEMENVRREYQVKDRNSQVSASQVILTA